MIHSFQSDSCLTINRDQHLRCLMAIQERLIDAYKQQLSDVRAVNDFDVDAMLASMFHNQTKEDLVVYKNAVLFMKQRLDFILDHPVFRERTGP